MCGARDELNIPARHPHDKSDPLGFFSRVVRVLKWHYYSYWRSLTTHFKDAALPIRSER